MKECARHCILSEKQDFMSTKAQSICIKVFNLRATTKYSPNKKSHVYAAQTKQFLLGKIGSSFCRLKHFIVISHPQKHKARSNKTRGEVATQVTSSHATQPGKPKHYYKNTTRIEGKKKPKKMSK